MTGIRIEVDDLAATDVRDLVAEHLREMHASSPACSVHALDVSGLRDPAVTMWTARRDGVLLGFGALKQLDPAHGELKSMRTTAAARGTGVGRAILAHLVEQARARGYRRLSLETGSQDHFVPARRLYARAGFEPCEPFAEYTSDPNSVYLTLELEP